MLRCFDPPFSGLGLYGILIIVIKFNILDVHSFLLGVVYPIAHFVKYAKV